MTKRRPMPSIPAEELLANSSNRRHPYNRACWSEQRLAAILRALGNPERVTAPMVARAALANNALASKAMTFVLPLLTLRIANKIAKAVIPQHIIDSSFTTTRNVFKRGRDIWEDAICSEDQAMLELVAALDDGHGTKWSKSHA